MKYHGGLECIKLISVHIPFQTYLHSFFLQNMENIEEGYETIGESYRKPFTALTISAVLVTVALTAAGITSRNNMRALLHNIHASSSGMSCSTIPDTTTGLQCAFYKVTASWYCLDQSQPSLVIDMSFISELDSFKAELSETTVVWNVLQNTLLCTAKDAQRIWICFYLSSLDVLNNTVTSTLNPDGLICACKFSSWVCWSSAQQVVTFGTIESLFASLLPTKSADHTLGCTFNALSNPSWQCGPLFNCVFQAKIGWACWAGNITTTTLSSAAWFSSTRDALQGAEISVGTVGNTTSQLCYFHPELGNGQYECAAANDAESMSDIAVFKREYTSTYQVFVQIYSCFCFEGTCTVYFVLTFLYYLLLI